MAHSFTRFFALSQTIIRAQLVRLQMEMMGFFVTTLQDEKDDIYGMEYLLHTGEMPRWI